MGQIIISVISSAMFGAIIALLIHINAEIQRLKREVQWLRRKIGDLR